MYSPFPRQALSVVIATLTLSSTAWAAKPPEPRSPIRHLIVVSGENRGFDHIFGTYTPKAGQSIRNLLSRGIVTAEGTPGQNFTQAEQQQALNTVQYAISPNKVGPYRLLPQPNTGLNALPYSPCETAMVLYGSVAFCTDEGLGLDDQKLLQLGGSGQFSVYLPPLAYPAPDCRYAAPLRNGPFSIIGASVLNADACQAPPAPIPKPTPAAVQSDSNTGDPVHRFYQMWQQSDCSMLQATAENPSGCLGDLHTWVATSVGWNITAPPVTDQDTYQGGIAMGFYNMAKGELVYFKNLADQFAISDNYHQPVMGGTGANSQFMVTGDVYYYTNAKGRPVKPNPQLIENPDPLPGTNNYYTNDAFGSADGGSTGVGYTNCSDENQPGVQPIKSYLRTLPYKPFNKGNCASGRWYQVNNNYPYYNTDGSVISTADRYAFPGGPGYAIGPQTIPTIGEALARRSIGWKYYGEGMDKANSPNIPENELYCEICNGFQYSKAVMTSPLKNNLADLPQFYADIKANQLPAVTFVKPDVTLDGHPGTSTPPLFEAFVKKIVDAVQANGQLWQDTAILITFDEGGGYYDSGYIQPIDFFGDGPRTVMIAVSPHAKKGEVDHTYADHASILKFIEWNWRLKPLSKRSRDNLPNPQVASTTGAAAYIPVNSPAIGDLQTLFTFATPQ